MDVVWTDSDLVSTAKPGTSLLRVTMWPDCYPDDRDRWSVEVHVQPKIGDSLLFFKAGGPGQDGYTSLPAAKGAAVEALRRWLDGGGR